MTFLDRWLPFKFTRRSAEEKKADAKPDRPSEGSLAPSDTSRPMPSVQQWMRDFFQHPFDEGRWPFENVEQWFGDFAPTRFSPHIDVSDEDGALKVTVELPGMSADDVELSIENGIMTIRGEKRHEDQTTEKGVYRTERYYGYVQRSLPLPENIDEAQAEASLEQGVLTVRFPRRELKESQRTNIPITA